MELDKFNSKEKPVLIDFYADWCGACQTMSPIIDDFEEKMGEDVGVVKVDVDRNPQLAESFNIRSIPTVILFKNGQQLWRKTGLITRRELEEMVKKHE